MKLRNTIGLLLVGGAIWFSSCSEDEPAKSGAAFEVDSEFLTESDATLESFHPLLIDDAVGRKIEVKILFDKPLEQKAVIEYSVGGTATQNSTANPYGDFEIIGNGENFTVEKGATEAVIVINLFEDFELEIDNEDDDGYFETIELTLESVVSGPVKLSEQTTYVMTIYEDDALIELNWNVGNGTRGDVDMDLLVWLDGEYLGASDQGGTTPEGLAIPAGFPAGTYGMSYTYYSGTSNTLGFTARMTNLGGKLNTSSQQLTFTGNYTLANINEYGDETSPNYVGIPPIIQTMVKSGFDYSSISDINEPTTGSRIKSSISSERLKSLKNKIKMIMPDGISRYH